jgi:hypothetical protein
MRRTSGTTSIQPSGLFPSRPVTFVEKAQNALGHSTRFAHAGRGFVHMRQRATQHFQAR